ncbi:MAG: alpha-glucan family phosphorylase, partial [Haloferula sp.]
HLVRLTRDFPNAAVVVGYELEVSRLLKCGSDLWLNNPVVTREASGTSGMSAAMNASVNISTYDGWVCEFAKDGHNSLIVPPADPNLSEHDRDQYDMNGLFDLIENKALPMFYDRPDEWSQLVINSMSDVVPFFDSDRMAAEYYENVYS